MDCPLEQCGQLAARLRPDLADAAAAGADQDRLVAGAGDVDRGVDPDRAVRALGKTLGLDGGAVRNFLMGLQKDLLAHDLGGEQPVRQVGQVVGRIQVRTGRHRGGECRLKFLDAVAGAGGDHVGLLKRRALGQIGDGRQQAAALDQINLVQHQPHAARQFAGDLAHALGHARLRIDQKHDEIGILCPDPGGGDHRAVEFSFGFEDARRVDQQDLRFALHQNAEHAEAGRLRLRADDRQFRAGQPVQQRRFARVRRADDGREPAAGHAVNAPSSASAASRSAARLDEPAPLAAAAPARASTTNSGSCGGPSREIWTYSGNGRPRASSHSCKAVLASFAARPASRSRRPTRGGRRRGPRRGRHRDTARPATPRSHRPARSADGARRRDSRPRRPRAGREGRSGRQWRTGQVRTRGSTALRRAVPPARPGSVRRAIRRSAGRAPGRRRIRAARCCPHPCRAPACRESCGGRRRRTGGSAPPAADPGA